MDTPILKFQNFQINFVSFHKHLGLTFFDDLTWKVYISSIIANAKKKLGLLKKKIQITLNRNSIVLAILVFFLHVSDLSLNMHQLFGVGILPLIAID